MMKYKCSLCEFETNDEEGLVGHYAKHKTAMMSIEKGKDLADWTKKHSSISEKEVTAFLDGWSRGYAKGSR